MMVNSCKVKDDDDDDDRGGDRLMKTVINDDGDGGGDGDGDNHKGDGSDCADVSGRVGHNLSDYYS